MFAFGVRIVFAVIMLVHCCHRGCRAANQTTCFSFCGNITISYPFRLETDHKHCGHNDFQLTCRDDRLELYQFDKIKYYVQAINYNNATIRIADAEWQRENCSSLPHKSISLGYPFGQFPDIYPYDWWSLHADNYVLFIKCANPVMSSPLYLDISRVCNGINGGGGHSYVKIGAKNVTDLADSCLIQLVYPVSLDLKHGYHNITYLDVRNSLLYGFELSWGISCCLISRNKKCVVQGVEVYNCNYFYDLLMRFVALYGGIIAIIVSLIVLLLRMVLFLFGFPMFIIFLIYLWRKRHLSMDHDIEEFLQKHANLMPVRYSYSDIKKITKNFKDKLGEGGYGCVYKGKLRSGGIVAVKVLGKSNADGQDFINEVATIGRIHHFNVVKLIGFCVEGLKWALVYEFMPNGSLDKHIFLGQDDDIIINTKIIYMISLGIAQGIEYLHRGCDMQILHFDIKPHNILLDENFTPKVADFGLAKLYSTDKSIVSSTAAKGTLGYMAPELFFASIGGVSHKADVYSYGMLLMEMAGRRKNFNAVTNDSNQAFFPLWVHEQYSEGNEIETEILANATEEERKMTKKMFIVALWCIQLNPVNRPSMRRVIEMLEGDVESLQIPPKRSLWGQEDAVGSTTNLTASTTPQSESSTCVSLVIHEE